MPKYLILIYEDASWEHPEAAALATVMQQHTTFAAANASAIRGGEALAFGAMATSIRPDGSGGFLVTDGPFVETKENLGGYYEIEAADMAAAVAIAEQAPMPPGCGVEIRPIRDFG